jgi:lipopolysaccharide assembly outer membrane protein LptD (OstA)
MKRLLAAVALAAMLPAGAALAQSPPPAQSALPGEFSNIGGFDSITTRTIDTNLNTGDFSIPQRFTASRSGTDISADHATGNTRKKLVHAVGNVVVHRTSPLEDKNQLSKVTQEPSTLTCDKLDIDGTRKTYVANGHVHFTQASRDATADHGTLDDVSNELHLYGNVHIRDKEQYLDADDVVYNTKTGDVRATGNPVMVRAPASTPVPAGLLPTPAGSPKAKGKR